MIDDPRLVAAIMAEAKARWTPTAGFSSPGKLAELLDPRTVHTPALDLIDQALVETANTHGGRLIVSMPPQEGKSQRCSRCFPLWMLLRNPDTKVAIASFQDRIARQWGRIIRDDINANPQLGLTIRHDVSAQHEWMLQGHEGGVYTTGVGGGLTSKRVDLMIVDDPVKDQAQADSKTHRDNADDWFRAVVGTRLSYGAPIVVIMTRWHQDDLAGRILDSPDADRWRVINIPAQADTDDDVLGRQPGEYMLSARGWADAEWEQKKIAAGSRVWNALFQGRPAPAEGGLLKREWWQHYNPQRLPGMHQIIQSWDLTFKGSDRSDFVAGQVWGQHGQEFFLLDQVRGRWSFTETVDQMLRLSAKWPQAAAKLVEDKANGPAVIDSLRGRLAGIIPINPDGGKEARAAAISPLIEAGNVWLPPVTHAPWVLELIEEAAAFPNATHDDQVDALTQALNRLGNQPQHQTQRPMYRRAG